MTQNKKINARLNKKRIIHSKAWRERRKVILSKLINYDVKTWIKLKKGAQIHHLLKCVTEEEYLTTDLVAVVDATTHRFLETLASKDIDTTIDRFGNVIESLVKLRNKLIIYRDRRQYVYDNNNANNNGYPNWR